MYPICKGSKERKEKGETIFTVGDSLFFPFLIAKCKMNITNNKRRVIVVVLVFNEYGIPLFAKKY